LVEVGKLTGPAACTVALDLLVGGHYVLRVKPGVDMQLLKAVLSALEA
jgi:hypothetical protein